MAAAEPTERGTAAGHPLDPLSAEEIRRAVAILRRDRGVGAGWRFGMIELRGRRQAVEVFAIVDDE